MSLELSVADTAKLADTLEALGLKTNVARFIVALANNVPTILCALRDQEKLERVKAARNFIAFTLGRSALGDAYDAALDAIDVALADKVG